MNCKKHLYNRKVLLRFVLSLKRKGYVYKGLYYRIDINGGYFLNVNNCIGLETN